MFVILQVYIMEQKVEQKLELEYEVALEENSQFNIEE